LKVSDVISGHVQGQETGSNSFVAEFQQTFEAKEHVADVQKRQIFLREHERMKSIHEFLMGLVRRFVWVVRRYRVV